MTSPPSLLGVEGLICACLTATMLFSSDQTIATSEIVTKCCVFIASKFDNRTLSNILQHAI